jgi:ABC-type multidrug transport system permease subunit
MGRAGETLELTRVQLLSFLREPEAVFWTFAFPLIVSAVLGFAFRRGELPASRVGLMPGPGAEELVARLEADPLLELVRTADEALARRGLQSGKLDVLVFPTGSPFEPRLLLDPDRPESESARLRVELALSGGAPRVAVEHTSGNGSRYIDFLYPGLLGLNLMATGMWSIGFAIAQMRQRKLVTPMHKGSFLSALFFARLVFLVLELAVLLGFGVWVLEVPFRASWLGFGLLCLTGAAAFAGLGLLATSRAKTIEGASGMLNFVMMPMWLLSGVFFSYERFPDWMHPVIRLLPLTALIDSLRVLMLEGGGPVEVLPALAWLGVCGLGAFLLALQLFRWE